MKAREEHVSSYSQASSFTRHSTCLHKANQQKKKGRPQPSAELKDLTHSFESGVLEQGNMENMQGGVP